MTCLAEISFLLITFYGRSLFLVVEKIEAYIFLVLPLNDLI